MMDLCTGSGRKAEANRDIAGSSYDAFAVPGICLHKVKLCEYREEFGGNLIEENKNS